MSSTSRRSGCKSRPQIGSASLHSSWPWGHPSQRRLPNSCRDRPQGCAPRRPRRTHDRPHAAAQRSRRRPQPVLMRHISRRDADPDRSRTGYLSESRLLGAFAPTTATGPKASKGQAKKRFDKNLYCGPEMRHIPRHRSRVRVAHMVAHFAFMLWRGATLTTFARGLSGIRVAGSGIMAGHHGWPSSLAGMTEFAPARRRALNWSARNASRNASLRERGSLTAWFDAGTDWRAAPSGKLGGRADHGGAAIRACPSLEVLLPRGAPRLAARADDRSASLAVTSLAVASLPKLAGPDWPVRTGRSRLAGPGLLGAVPAAEDACRAAALPGRRGPAPLAGGPHRDRGLRDRRMACSQARRRAQARAAQGPPRHGRG